MAAIRGARDIQAWVNGRARAARLVTFHGVFTWATPVNPLDEIMQLEVTNDSDEPMLDLEPRLLLFDAGDETYSGAFELIPFEVRNLGAAKRLTAHSAGALKLKIDYRLNVNAGSRLRIELDYTDASGRRWRRRGSEPPQALRKMQWARWFVGVVIASAIGAVTWWLIDSEKWAELPLPWR